MLANRSIQYMKRLAIDEEVKAPSVQELIDFLNRLMMGRQGDFKVIGLNLPMTVQELRYNLEIFKEFEQKCIMFLIPDRIKITHYTLNGHDSTLILN